MEISRVPLSPAVSTDLVQILPDRHLVLKFRGNRLDATLTGTGPIEVANAAQVWLELRTGPAGPVEYVDLTGLPLQVCCSIQLSASPCLNTIPSVPDQGLRAGFDYICPSDDPVDVLLERRTGLPRNNSTRRSRSGQTPILAGCIHHGLLFLGRDCIGRALDAELQRRLADVEQSLRATHTATSPKAAP